MNAGSNPAAQGVLLTPMTINVGTGSVVTNVGCGFRQILSQAKLSRNPQAAADGPHMAKAAAACGVLR